MAITHRRHNWLIALILITLVLPASGSSSVHAQTSRTFPETGHSISGRFLEYWEVNGGLPQQGYPISDEMQETSLTDGKTYKVQYFERAVFEHHAENQPSNDVLLQLLGVFRYNEKYGSAGAPGQEANNQAGFVLFPETGHRVGGRFLDYWQNNGGLAQQGYPISEEFQEKSELDGNTYTVQYFERAVFELHPENQPPYDVLLSQLGTLQYRKKYLQPSPTATVPIVATPSSTPTTIPTPSATPAVSIYDCAGIPPTSLNEMELAPTCTHLWTTVGITGIGFGQDVDVSIWATMPNGEVLSAPFNVPVRANDRTAHVLLSLDDLTPYFGIWIITMEGRQSGRKVYGYFKLVPDEVPIPEP
jgi:hypothetical protein